MPSDIGQGVRIFLLFWLVVVILGGFCAGVILTLILKAVF
jgi:hypothetical protein